ncbi:uncharacterized protein EV420DRAFT_1189239 [Desarmillaria tabescens]|uniref:Uncharacterized protein n=1 Tax=Armillaria tabescens TaxID=1929756 RepID=A0AA39NB95_ARMTA|nr:uncharacterized protein EV420DRAFT_1189239 [Desarmillaria tabescens]KAK0462466.1 hypothetical protein EV420DRAFT_1189239 [Desarmillaria tabescens]
MMAHDAFKLSRAFFLPCVQAFLPSIKGRRLRFHPPSLLSFLPPSSLSYAAHSLRRCRRLLKRHTRYHSIHSIHLRVALSVYLTHNRCRTMYYIPAMVISLPYSAHRLDTAYSAIGLADISKTREFPAFDIDLFIGRHGCR